LCKTCFQQLEVLERNSNKHAVGVKNLRDGVRRERAVEASDVDAAAEGMGQDEEMPESDPVCAAIKVRLDDGRVREVRGVYRQLLVAIYSENADDICQAICDLPIDPIVGDIVIVTLQKRLVPEMKRLLQRSSLRWRPKADPIKSRRLISNIGETLPFVVSESDKLAKTYVGVVRLLTDRDFNAAKDTALLRPLPAMNTFVPDGEASDSGNDPDWTPGEDSGSDSAAFDGEDLRGASGSEAEEGDATRSRARQRRARAREAAEEARESARDSKKVVERMLMTRGAAAREMQPGCSVGLLLFNYDEGFSLVASWMGMNLS
jgi:hypothetical protein